MTGMHTFPINHLTVHPKVLSSIPDGFTCIVSCCGGLLAARVVLSTRLSSLDAPRKEAVSIVH